MKEKNLIEKNSVRYSGIELLKIIGIFLIILCHSIPLYKYNGVKELSGYINLNISSMNINIIILQIFSYMGQIGNIIFIISSFWFLLKSDKVKSKKIWLFEIDLFFISILFLLLFVVFGFNISKSDILNSLIAPIGNFYWFIVCYILLYLIHPLINIIIRNINQKIHILIVAISLLFYSIINFIFTGVLYYNQLIGFISIYFLLAYLQKYMLNFCEDKKYNIFLCIMSTLALILQIILSDYIGLHISFLNDEVRRFESFSNLFIILIGISAFNIFSSYKFQNRFINRISSTSFLVYILGNNFLACKYIKPILFSLIYENGYYDYIVYFCLIIAVITLLVSIIAAIIYQNTFQKITIKISNYIVKFTNYYGDKIFIK